MPTAVENPTRCGGCRGDWHSANSGRQAGTTVHKPALYGVSEQLGDVAGVAHPSCRVDDGTRDRSERRTVAQTRRSMRRAVRPATYAGAAPAGRGDEEMDRRPAGRSAANAVAPRGVYAVTIESGPPCNSAAVIRADRSVGAGARATTIPGARRLPAAPPSPTSVVRPSSRVRRDRPVARAAIDPGRGVMEIVTSGQQRLEPRSSPAGFVGEVPNSDRVHWRSWGRPCDCSSGFAAARTGGHHAAVSRRPRRLVRRPRVGPTGRTHSRNHAHRRRWPATTRARADAATRRAPVGSRFCAPRRTSMSGPFQVGDDQAQEGRHRRPPRQDVRQADQEHRGRRAHRRR